MCSERDTGTHAAGEPLCLWEESGQGRCGSANGGREGGEEKDEGRVGVRSDTLAPNTTSSLAAEGETWIGHGRGGYIHWMLLRGCDS